jgi:tetratricopeptide (TPR) repeat protein
LKKINWNPRIKDLLKLFPLEDPLNIVYIVEELGKSLQEGDGAATYSLLNLTREFYLRNKKIVIYKLPSNILFKQLQWKAADFWSFRTASFDFFLEEDFRAIIKDKISAELEGYEKDSEKVALLEDLLVRAKKEKKQGHKEIANLLTKLGNLYSDLGDTGKALKYHEQVLELDRQLGYKQGEASDLGNIGLIYSDLGQPQKALTYLQTPWISSKKSGTKQKKNGF